MITAAFEAEGGASHTSPGGFPKAPHLHPPLPCVCMFAHTNRRRRPRCLAPPSSFFQGSPLRARLSPLSGSSPSDLVLFLVLFLPSPRVASQAPTAAQATPTAMRVAARHRRPRAGFSPAQTPRRRRRRLRPPGPPPPLPPRRRLPPRPHLPGTLARRRRRCRPRRLSPSPSSSPSSRRRRMASDASAVAVSAAVCHVSSGVP